MSLSNKSVAASLLTIIKGYIDKHISVLTKSLENKNKTKRFKVPKGTTSVSTGTPFITNDSLISFDRIIGNPATSIANIGVDGDYFVDGGKIHFKEFNKDIVISCGVNYGTHDISQADILGQKTTEADISKMKHEVDMLSGSGIGYDGIYYIQDVGSKMQGKIYLDKTQEGIWKCLKTTTSINNTLDFERIDSTTLDDRIRNISNINPSSIRIGNMLIQYKVVDNLEFNQNSATNPTFYDTPYKSPPFGFIMDWSRYQSSPCKALFHPGTGGFRNDSFNISCSGVIHNGSIWDNATATANGVRGRVAYIVIGEV